MLKFSFTIVLLCSLFSCSSSEKTYLAQNSNPVKLSQSISKGAELNYAFLQLHQAMVDNDQEMLINACNTLIKIEPQSSALIEASSWLIASRANAEARDILEKTIQAVPEKLQLHLLLAETFLIDHQITEAMEIIKAYTIAYPDNMAAKIELAIITAQNSKPEEAIKIFSSLSEEAKNPVIRYYYALALISQKEYTQALKELKKAIEVAPNFYEAQVELAYTYEAIGDEKSAKALIEKLLAQAPNNQEEWFRLDLVKLVLREGDAKKALDIAKLAPDSNNFLLDCINIFLEAKRYNEAKILLQDLVNDPNSPPDVYFLLATISYELDKDLSKTLGYLNQISEADFYYDKALNLKIQVYYEQEDFGQALDTAIKGQEAFPNTKDFWYAASQLSIVQKDYTKALEYLSQGIENNPSDTELLYSKASLLELAGEREEAISLMEEILVLNPLHYVAMNYIGYTFAEENRNLERAKLLITKALELAPNSDYIYDSLAWVEFQQGDYPQAWESIKKTVSLSQTEDSTMWYHYGRIALANKLLNEAKFAYDIVVKNDDKLAAELLKLIQEYK